MSNSNPNNGIFKPSFIKMSDKNVRVIDNNALVAKKMEEYSNILRERELAASMPEDGDEQGFTHGGEGDPQLDALTGEPIEGEYPEGEYPADAEGAGEFTPGLNAPGEQIDPDAPGPLSVDEVREECQQLINEANLKAQDIIDDAKANATRIKEEALEEGYNAGKESALQELIAAKRELEAHEEQMREEYDRLLEELEPKMVEAITDVYAHVFGNNFFSQRDVMVTLVNKALRHVDTADSVMIEVSNEDYDMLIGMKTALYDKIMIKNEPEIVRRDDFKRGQAKIETPYGIIDCSIDTELTELTRYLKMLSYDGRKTE